MRSLLRPLAISVLLGAAGTAFGAGGAQMPGGSLNAAARTSATPQEQAREAYNYGVRAVRKADALQEDAARQPDARRRQKLLDKARAGYAGARKMFTRATALNPAMHEAWNYLGYTSRRLGEFAAALAAYDRALRLKPGYLEAIEYRGHAFLGLNRLGDAQDAYLTLFAKNRALAAQLLAGMQEWVAGQRGIAAGVDGVSLESFAAWVDERSVIAAQTAGLTRGGNAAAW